MQEQRCLWPLGQSPLRGHALMRSGFLRRSVVVADEPFCNFGNLYLKDLKIFVKILFKLNPFI